MAGAPREEEAWGRGRTLASSRGIWPNPQTGVSPGGGGESWSLRPAVAAAPPLLGHHSAAVLEGRALCKASFLSSGPSAAPRWEAPQPPPDAQRHRGSPPADHLLKQRLTSYRRGQMADERAGLALEGRHSRSSVTRAHSPVSAPSYSVPRRRCSVATRECACCSQDSRYLSPCAKPAPREGRSA